MPKDVIITPANSFVEFRDVNSNVDAMIYLDNSRNLNIINPNGSMVLGNTAANVYIGDGVSVVDIIFEQNGGVRALTGKTLTLGQSDSFISIPSVITLNANSTFNGNTFFNKPVEIRTTAAASKIAIYNEDGTAPIADTFADTTTDKSYIYFNAGDSSNDPGYIMHETSDSEVNEGVLHLCPSDDNSEGDYVSIHGTNDPDAIRLHTNGLIETGSGVHLALRSGTGNVGIGTLTPTANLTVVGTGNFSANITVGAGSAAAPALTTSGDINTGIFFPAADTIAFAEGGSEVMRIDANGNVSIGTTSTTFKLDVAGTGGAAIRNAGGSAFLEIGVGATGNNFAYLDLTGDTTYTDYGLRVIRNNGGPNTDSAIEHRGTGTLLLRTTEAGPITFHTTNAERLRIVANGWVGIGTTSPTANLDVFGTSRFGGTVSLRRVDIDSVGISTFSYNDNGLATQIRLDNLDNNAAADHGSSITWRLATNTSATAINAGRISIAKQQVWTSTSSTQESYMAFSTSAGASGLGERMRIAANGFVGIGITSPTSNLHVIGSGIISANLEANTYTTGQTTASISSGTLTINLNLGTVFVVTLNANITTLTISNLQPSSKTSSFVLLLVGDGTSRAITWPTSFKFPSNTAPTITSTLNKVSIVTAFTYDAGTNWYAILSGSNF